MSESVCWIVIITVDFPGRRNKSFPEDADLLMCEMKARIVRGNDSRRCSQSLFSAGEKEVLNL